MEYVYCLYTPLGMDLGKTLQKLTLSRCQLLTNMASRSWIALTPMKVNGQEPAPSPSGLILPGR